MLQTLFPNLTYIKGKSKNVYLVASVVIVTIQESCLKFHASFPAPFKVFSNVKDLVLSLVQSSLASQPVFFFFCHLVGKKDLGFGLFPDQITRKTTGWLARLHVSLKMQVQTSLLVNIVSRQSILKWWWLCGA